MRLRRQRSTTRTREHAEAVVAKIGVRRRRWWWRLRWGWLGGGGGDDVDNWRDGMLFCGFFEVFKEREKGTWFAAVVVVCGLEKTEA